MIRTKLKTLLQNSLKIGSYTQIRNIALSQRLLAYEGDGKTTVQILNNEPDLGLMVNGVSQVGFRLNNEMTVLGSMLIFPRTVLSWNVETVNDITEESLAMFTVLEPKPDILVIGVGDGIWDTCVYKQILPIGRKIGISVEILPTERAASTFNFLNSEGRFVVGAMIPPASIQPTEDDVAQTKLRYQNVYEIEDIVKFK